MKASHAPTSVLFIWLVIAIISIVLGAGFAGGFTKLFTFPIGLDAASLVALVLTWAFLLAPFVLLGRRLISRLLNRSTP